MKIEVIAILCLCLIIAIAVWFRSDYSYTFVGQTASTIIHMSEIVIIEKRRETIIIYHKNSTKTVFTLKDNAEADLIFEELSLKFKMYNKRQLKFL